MSLPFKVEPGELITATLATEILEQLRSHEQRLAALEATQGGLAITNVFPLGLIRMGTEVRLTGRNFGMPGSNTVVIESTLLNQFKPGSRDDLLIFDMPTIGGIPNEGKTVTLSLSNDRGFTSTSITVAPGLPTIPNGTLVVTPSAPPPPTVLEPGGSYEFVYSITAITNMDETFTLTPGVEPKWKVSMLDAEGTPLTPPELLIRESPPPGTVRQVKVKVTIPDTVSLNDTASLLLTVTSKLNKKMTGTSGSQTLTVGQSPPPPPPISISVSQVLGEGSLVNGEVRAPAGKETAIELTMNFPKAGRYSAVVSIPNDPSEKWEFEPKDFEIELNAPRPGETVLVGVTPTQDATPVSLKLRVEGKDDPTQFGEINQRLVRV
ncbi:hypothetical protein COCOR_02851 [Corallococcus coralloides DSM 2259]|uniref:IPT/TIG domain-containing protein n=1 Tax=Corallococcus coralloides (strain ATCC 25202 / DSM 2259 / NBRC 100086 / M2) TaxID=1144275 RepID=H8MX59_CORCM|nr:hypothetical protein [Corallococcus coralloides]AFE04867.1 hypothetical protein COCOR_02851 [Corallococcus coralloides DSM 2259]